MASAILTVGTLPGFTISADSNLVEDIGWKGGTPGPFAGVVRSYAVLAYFGTKESKLQNSGDPKWVRKRYLLPIELPKMAFLALALYGSKGHIGL